MAVSRLAHWTSEFAVEGVRVYMNILPIDEGKRRRFGFLLGLAIVLYIFAVILFIIAY
jgi:hypothetical protein